MNRLELALSVSERLQIKMAKPQEGKKPQLLVVSNRLPLSLKRVGAGKYQSSTSSGGLVTSLSGISESIGFQWFGWTGLEIPEDEQEEVQKLLAERNAVPIFLNQELANNHYNGFSSGYFHIPFPRPLSHELWSSLTIPDLRLHFVAGTALSTRNSEFQREMVACIS